MSIGWITGIVLLAVLIDVLLMRWLRARTTASDHQQADDKAVVRVGGAISPILTLLRYGRLPTRMTPFPWRRLRESSLRQVLQTIVDGRTGSVIEIGLIGVWAFYIGRTLLDPAPWVWPAGREFGIQVQPHHFWTQLLRCVECAWWDGSLNGGAPALADTFGATLHPVVGITTLLFGVVNGAKLTFIGALWMAGIAQWWIARLMNTGRLARIWSGLLVVAAGHLCGRMELGAIGLVVSIATASLCLAAALDVGLGGGRRAAVRLGFIGAMLIVSGHGYLQLGFLSLAPTFALFMVDGNLRLKRVWRDYVLAVAISILLAGILLVPTIHTWSSLEKWRDASFSSAQPLEYLPLNLVIRDWEYLQGTSLGKLPLPHLYTLYVGWMPIGLGAIGLFSSSGTKSRCRWFLAATIAGSFLMASAIALRPLARWIPFLAGFRHTTSMASLAIPGLMGLAALGLDRLLAWGWPRIGLDLGGGRPFYSLSLRWLLLVPLVGSLSVVEENSQVTLGTVEVAESPSDLAPLRTDSLQWVAPPLGEHFWVELGMETNLKLTDAVKTWWWKDRELPSPRLVMPRDAKPTGLEPVGLVGDLVVYEDPQQEYAYIQTAKDRIPCRASGLGGDVTVRCRAGGAGQLVIHENNWSGWKAWRDELRIPLQPGDWLAVAAMAGDHIYQFRYRPWDVWLGLAMSAVGWALVVWIWLYNGQRGEANRVDESAGAATDQGN